MNNSMLPSMDDKPLRDRRRPAADEPTPSRLPPACAVLEAVWDRRRKRAADALLLAERQARCARARQEEAEHEAARLLDASRAIEREWHSVQRGRDTLGLEFHRARAAIAQRDALAKQQAEHALMLARDSAETRRVFKQARERHSRQARKEELLRALKQRLDIGGNE